MKSFSAVWVMLAFTITTDLSAGPWPQGKGRGLFSLSLGRYQTSRGTNGDGNIFEYDFQGRFVSDRLGMYVEYGLTEETTFIGNFSYVSNGFSSQFQDQRSGGFPDQEFGVSYSLSTFPIALSVSATYLFPSLYSLDQDPMLGFGEHAVQVMVGAGKGFDLTTWPAWISGEAGYRRYFGVVSDQFLATFTLGTQPTPAWMLTIQLLGTDSPYPHQILQNLNPNIVSGYSLIKVSALALVSLNDSFSLVATYTKDVWGKRSGFGDNITLGVWYRLGGAALH